MRLSASRALFIYLVTPLPLIVGMLLISGAWPGVVTSPTVISALSVLASVLLFCSVLRNRGTESRMEGWRSLGVLATAGSIVLYVIGSYYGSPLAQWVALLGMYDAILLYMGGTELVGYVLLPTVALVPLAISGSGLLEDLFAIAFAGASVGSATTLFRRRHRGSEGPCPECGGYTAGLKAHCLYCGKSLGRLMVSVDGRKIAKVGVLTALLLIASATPIQVLWVQGGNPHSSTLRLSGLTIGPPIASSSGWNVTRSDVKVNGSLSVASFELTKGGQTVAVTIASSPSKEAALGVATGVYPDTRRNGTIALGGSPSVLLLFGTTGNNLTALSWDTMVDSFNGTSVQPLTVAYVAGENLTRTKLNDSGLYSVATASLLDFQGIQQWNWFLSVVGSNWYNNTTYIGIVGAVFFITLPFETARRKDEVSARHLENTLGLTHQELGVLAIISTNRAPKTGKQLLDSMPNDFDRLDWPSLQGVLLKLEGLGLVREVIGRGQSGSMLFWESRIK